MEKSLIEDIIPKKYVDLNDVNFNLDDFKIFSKEFMCTNCLIPIQITEDKILVAMGDPNNKKIIENVETFIKKTTEVVTARKEQIYELINRMDEIGKSNLILEQLKRKHKINGSIQQNELNNESYVSSENSPVVMITNSIITQAINTRASDIHMEPYLQEASVRFRIDGTLSNNIKIPMASYLSVCSRIKVQAGMDIAEKRIPQDGKFQYKNNNIIYDLRVSTLPTIYGEKIVIRILYKKEKLQNLESLGFNIRKNDSILNMLKNTHGIILVTGPTGSGKTTTLYAMLEAMDKDRNNIVTIEDPVEMEIAKISQVSVNNKAGLNFSNGLRSILRQDPDIILVGEIRDEETAQIAVRAAITGHLVFSTLHTNDAVSSVIRLIEMGVPRYLVADALVSCLAQRLVRTICNFCKTEYMPSKAQIESLNLNSTEKLYKGTGCIFCNFTGYKGRTVIYEIVRLDSIARTLICEGKGVDSLKTYLEDTGFNSLIDNCKSLVRSGITSYDELLSLCSYN